MNSQTRRCQLKRTNGWRLPENTVKVDRTTLFGNPWQHGPCGVLHWPDPVKTGWITQLAYIFGGEPAIVDQETCVRWYRDWLRTDYAPLPETMTYKLASHVEADLTARRAMILTRLPELRGKNLACWCKLDGSPCHADVLLEIANE